VAKIYGSLFLRVGLPTVVVRRLRLQRIYLKWTDEE
jgi:hypothetical protein